MGFKRLALNDGASAHISRGEDLNAKAMTLVQTNNSNGSFSPDSYNTKYQVFAVGGGAGGGGWRAGGGGAGGAVFFEGVQFSGTSNITIGSQGSGANSGQFLNGGNGGTTSMNAATFIAQSNNKNTLSNISVDGGGRGAGQGQAGGSGGCGGGSGADNNTTPTGNIGGNGGPKTNNNSYMGGGGGGMGSDLTGANGAQDAGDGFAFLGENYCAGGGQQGFYGSGGGGDVGGTNVGGNGGSTPNNGGGYGSGGGSRKNDSNSNSGGHGSAGRMQILKYEQPTLAGNVANIKKVKKL
tara:strand:- start:26 stop:910 length:885 start_codon:yes stop_codon:yes gene_type:complete